jgi:lipopolysaccharide/colanic/teichoic acid biosynthesis glycosyltransferase
MLLDTTNEAEQIGRIDELLRATPSSLVGSGPFLTIAPRHGWYLPIKNAADFVLAAVILLLVSPVLAISALLVKLTSRGPVVFQQTRVGQDGRTYTILKLRTMRHNCEALSGPQWSKPGDTRITPIGRLLRVTHIDEFPQLWNVLRGEMSLIGPRPERPEFVQDLEKQIPNYRNRLVVRPGITGLAQVNLPPDSDVSTVRRKLSHDMYYLHHTNPWLDFRILLCTVLTSLGIPFRFRQPLHRLLGMPSERAIKRTYESSLSSAEMPVIPASVLEAMA